MNRRKSTIRIVTLLAAGAFLAFALLYPFRFALTVTDARGTLLYAESARPGDTFELRFIHSVHRTPVEEAYTIDQSGGLVLERVVYETYGVGNPSQAEPGQRFRIEDGKMIIDSFDRRFDAIRLRIGQRIAEHELIVGGRAIPLREIGAPGERVTIKAKKLSVWSLLTRQRGGHHDEYEQ